MFFSLFLGSDITVAPDLNLNIRDPFSAIVFLKMFIDLMNNFHHFIILSFNNCCKRSTTSLPRARVKTDFRARVKIFPIIHWIIPIKRLLPLHLRQQARRSSFIAAPSRSPMSASKTVKGLFFPM